MSGSKVTPPTELVSKDIESRIEELARKMGFKDITMSIIAATKPGDNYMSVVAKVQVMGKDKDSSSPRVLNLMVKSAPRNEGFRKMAPMESAYLRENYVYEEVLPKYIEFQEKRGIQDPFKAFAKCYFTCSETLNEALAMENMKERGFEVKDRQKPLSSQDVMLVMKEYGKFHAISYALRDQEPGVFEELRKNLSGHFFETWDPAITEQTSMHQYDKVLQALTGDEVAYQKCKDLKENIKDRLYAAIKADACGDYAAIAHGDCWVNNMLFKCGDPSKPNVTTDLCFIDWQLACMGSPVLDLSYFIFTCTDSQTREKHYNEFLNTYYQSLSTFMRKLGSDPDRLYPRDVFVEHWKKFSVYGFHMASMVLFLMLSDTDEIPDFHSMSDMEEAMKHFSYVSKNADKYNERVRGVVLDFIRYGYL